MKPSDYYKALTRSKILHFTWRADYSRMSQYIEYGRRASKCTSTLVFHPFIYVN
jgi:hypothetical protein